MSANVAKHWTFIRTVRYSTLCRRRAAIANKNSRINAFVNIFPAPPPLHDKNLQLDGLTVAVKDNIATRSLPTTCSSTMLRGFTSPFDATVVSLLQDSGADVIGKTNCDEFGMGSLNIHSCHGPVRNPVNQDCATDSLEARSAGGSSGGSAAAVAAGLCDAALGTDTGGSVRLPASYCGVVGFKPSYGLISRWGVVSYADSLDCVGILASDVDTTERVFHTLAVYDALDPTAAPLDLRKKAYQYTEKRLSSVNFAKSNSLEGLRVGIPQEYFPSELSTEIIQQLRNVVSELRLRGAMVIPISLPSTTYALSSYYVLASAEASSNLARYDGVQYGSYVKPPPDTDITKTSNVYAQSRTAGFGQEVQKRILLGTYALSADAFDNYFLQAQRVRQLIKEDFNRVFSIPNYYSDSPITPSSNSPKIDVLLHPSAIRTAPLLNEGSSSSSDLSAYVQDVLTVPASLAGLPALSIPVKSTNREPERWPVGISVVGQWGTDEMVLAVGKVVQDLYRES